MKQLSILLIAGILCGCAVSPSMTHPVEPNKDDLSKFKYGETPIEYKKIVEDYVKAGLIDPESAQFTRFSNPKKDWLSDNEIGGNVYIGWLVCVEVNAKNKFGGYAGRKTYTLILKDNKVLFSQNDYGVKIVGNGWGAPNKYPIECDYSN